MTGAILVMAGGTGGHVFPALAVAQQLRRAGRDVVWLGTRRGIEARLVPAAGLPIEWLDVQGLRGRGPARWLAAPFTLARALWQALRIMRRLRPAAVLGCGGFVSGPGGVAAWLTRTPLVIHEQNAVAGLTNRCLSRLAGSVAEAFPGSFAPGRHALATGNPVRAEIAALPPPPQRFAARSGPPQLLVFGGSQGAAVLNRIVPRAVAQLPAAERPRVLHQSGSAERDAVVGMYLQLGVEAGVCAFIGDMAAAYRDADLAVCRAGALTVSELAAAGLGAVLVPFPSAVDDHQTRNAALLVSAGAAVLLPQQELTDRRLANELAALLSGGRARTLDMACAARAVAVTDAAERVAGLCLAAAEGRP